MARAHGKLLASIWTDQDWLARTSAAQRLYVLLLTQPKLTLAGMLDYMPSRWAKLAVDTSVADIETAVDELEASRFVCVDRNTDELLIRTLVKHDIGPSRLNVNLLTGLWRSWASIQSRQLRAEVIAVIPNELWTDTRCQPHPDAIEIRDQLSHNPTSPPLQPAVATSGSNERSEPAVPTSLLPSPFSLLPSPTAAALTDLEGPARRTVEQQRHSLVDKACEILTERHLERNPTKGSSTKRHRNAVYRGKLDDHRDAAYALLAQRRAWTPEQLADELEPATAEPSGRLPEWQPQTVEGALDRDTNAGRARGLRTATRPKPP